MKDIQQIQLLLSCQRNLSNIQCIIERHIKEAVRASQFYENIDVTGLILNTITELQTRKQEDNKRLYHPPREDQPKPYFFILPKTGSTFKVKCVNIAYSIGKCLRGGDNDELEIVMMKRHGRLDIITAYPCS